MAEFYDTHTHLGFPEFAADLPAVLQRARAAGIVKLIIIGTDLASSVQAVALAEANEGVFAAVGWHPGHALEAPADVSTPLRELARHDKVVAIGETGLDFFQRAGAEKSPEEFAHYKKRQAEIFQQQLEVAIDLGLNCIIHQRSSFAETLAQLSSVQGKTRGVFHCFSEPVASLQQILAMGSLVSFTGIVTFKNGQNARDALAAAPMGQFMLETDCPYLAPVPFRGSRCEPAHVREIAITAAEVKHCSLAELSQATNEAAQVFFPKLAGRN